MKASCLLRFCASSLDEQRHNRKSSNACCNVSSSCQRKWQWRDLKWKYTQGNFMVMAELCLVNKILQYLCNRKASDRPHQSNWLLGVVFLPCCSLKTLCISSFLYLSPRISTFYSEKTTIELCSGRNSEILPVPQVFEFSSYWYSGDLIISSSMVISFTYRMPELALDSYK